LEFLSSLLEPFIYGKNLGRVVSTSAIEEVVGVKLTIGNHNRWHGDNCKTIKSKV
jgi:hypothetical protein